MRTTATTSPELDLAQVLRDRGHRVTPQRLVIHRTLRELNRHVTADEVLSAVGERLPHVSAPTVYATLELFEELGLVCRISRGPDASLYDPRTDPHHHLLCAVCGAVEDVDADVELSPALRAARRRGFAPARAEVLVRGLCRSCAA